MAVKINLMTIIALIALLFGVIAIGCYEGGIALNHPRHDYLNFYEAAIVISSFIALVSIILTAIDKPKALVGRIFMFFGLCSLLLVIGIILVIVYHARRDRAIGAFIASYIFGGLQLVTCLVATLTPCFFPSTDPK
jgi:hypothetical protein